MMKYSPLTFVWSDGAGVISNSIAEDLLVLDKQHRRGINSALPFRSDSLSKQSSDGLFVKHRSIELQ
jgi:hypothetical protein